MAFNLTGLAVVAANIYVGSVGFLMVVTLFVLSTPASVFVRAIRDMERIGLSRGDDPSKGT